MVRLGSGLMCKLVLARLVLSGGRGFRLRLTGMAVGVAIGVMLVMMLWAGFNALTIRAERSSWTTIQTGTPITTPGPVTLSADQLLAASRTDHFHGHLITRVDVAATAGTRMQIPGVSAVPRPGTYFASPALHSLIASTPAQELEDRYGTFAGTIANSALVGPESLVVVVGQSPQTVADFVGAQVITGQFGLVGAAFINTNYRTIGIIGAIAIILPVLLLIGISTQLGAAERGERFSALRLIGATPALVSQLAAVETGLTSLFGALGGVILARSLFPLEAQFSVENTTFFPADLSVDLPTTIVLISITVLTTATAAWYRARAAPIGPLGSTWQSGEHRPRRTALLPLIVGLLMMLGATVGSITYGQKQTITAGSGSFSLTEPAIVGGFVLTAIGLLAAGPMITNWISSVAVLRTSNAADLIALNRIRRHPRATFRAVSGLVMAIFMISVFAGAATTATGASATVNGPNYLAAGTVTAYLSPTMTPSLAVLKSEIASITGLPGVVHAAIGYIDPEDGLIFTASDLRKLGLPATGVSLMHINNGVDANTPATITRSRTSDLAQLTPAVIWVATNGRGTTIERVRTAVISGPAALILDPTTRSENNQSSLQELVDRYKNLANLGILIATVIASISLAISTTVSVIDRKRVLGLLRLTGMPASALQRMIVTETIVPLLTVFIGSAGLGFFSAWCIVAGLTAGGRTTTWPDISYYVVIAASLALALAAILATFSTAKRTTAINSTRFE
jgi:hypothetical protein